MEFLSIGSNHQNKNNIKCLTWNVSLRFDPTQPDLFDSKIKMILRELDNNPDLDLICLQEVELKRGSGKNKNKTGLLYFKSLLKDYDAVIHETKDIELPSGNLTLWRRSKFKLVDSSNKFQFDIPDQKPVKALHVNLLHLDSNQILCLINVHLKAGLRSGEKRRALELEKCLEISLENKYMTCICGDFNDDLQIISEECPDCSPVKSNYLGLLTKLITKYKFTLNDGLPSCCIKTKDPNDIIKYMNFDRVITFNINASNINSPYVLLTTNNVEIPNAEFPFDHLPIRFELIL